MSPGQVSKVFCPHALDHGSSPNNYKTSGSGWVEEGTDLTYEMEVLDCSEKPDFTIGEKSINL